MATKPSDELFELLDTPAMRDRMRAAGTSPVYIGFPEHPPDEGHDALWKLILAERPDWRPWYEAAQEEATRAFAWFRTQPERSDSDPGIPHDEAMRRVFGEGYPRG